MGPLSSSFLQRWLCWGILWDHGPLPTALCRDDEALEYKRLLDAAGKINSRKWKSVLTAAFKERMAHPNQG